MDLLLFPGNHPSTLKWTRNVEDGIGGLFNSTYIQEYLHWKTGDELIMLENELERAQIQVKGKRDYSFLSLSVGTLLVLKGVHEDRLTPERCIFVGTAVEGGRRLQYDVDLWISDFRIPTLFIQKTKDPACNFKDLKSLFENSCDDNCEFIELPGNEHNYEDIESINDYAASYIAKF